jgi:hypothetical protein
MDQSVVATFKQYCMRIAVSHAIRATAREGGPALKEFWKGCNIWNAVNIIGNFWA